VPGRRSRHAAAASADGRILALFGRLATHGDEMSKRDVDETQRDRDEAARKGSDTFDAPSPDPRAKRNAEPADEGARVDDTPSVNADGPDVPGRQRP